MTDLSYTQEFYLCAVNQKGKFPWTNAEASRCLLAGAAMELLESGVVARDAKGRLVIGRAWGDGTVERPLGEAAAGDGLVRPAEAQETAYQAPPEPAEPGPAGEPGAYLRPLYEEIAGFPKPKALDGLAEYYLMGLTSKHLARLMQAIGASLWEAECADVIPDDDPARIRYAPRHDATMRVVEKIRSEVLEAGAMPDDMLTLVFLLDRSGIIRDYFSKIDVAALKARLKEVRQSPVPSAAREMLDKIDQDMAVMMAVISASTVIH